MTPPEVRPSPAMGVIDRVHRDTAHTGACPANGCGRLCQDSGSDCRVGHRANGRHAFGAHHPQLARRQTHLRVCRRRDRRAAHRRPRNARSDRPCPASVQCCGRSCRPACASNGIALPGFTSTRSSAMTLSPTPKTLRRQDVGQLAIFIFDQRDERRPVRIIFHALDRALRRRTSPLEIDDPIAALVTAATMARR